VHKKLRHIKIDGLPYVWRVVWSKMDFTSSEGYGEFFVAWLEGRKSSPMKIMFLLPEGYQFDEFLNVEPLNNTPKHPQIRIRDFLLPESWRDEYRGALLFNAHRPRVVAHLIRYARGKGWDPEASSRPHILDIGPDLLGEKIP